MKKVKIIVSLIKRLYLCTGHRNMHVYLLSSFYIQAGSSGEEIRPILFISGQNLGEAAERRMEPPRHLPPHRHRQECRSLRFISTSTSRPVHCRSVQGKITSFNQAQGQPAKKRVAGEEKVAGKSSLSILPK